MHLANLEGAILDGVDLGGAIMPNGEFYKQANLNQANVEETNQAITPNEKLQEANLKEAVPKVAFWKQAILPLISGVVIFIGGVILGWTAQRKRDR